MTADPNGVWLYVDHAQPLPARGWKLHVSATPWNAAEVLERCVPVLMSEGATFKIAASADRVAELNQGAGGARQAGKFVTAYPVDDDQAVRLARALDEATTGMRGPRVITDRPLSPASLVHYRYADFVLTAEGDGGDPGARDRPGDPFVAAGLVGEPQAKLIAGRYLITANLNRSVRGAVHLAVDAVERRTCVLKRAWRDAALMPDGTDARDRLRDEASVMRRFDGDPHFPAIWDVVEDDLDLFVAMEHVEGKTFAQVVHELYGEKRPPSNETLVRWGSELADAVERIHSEGLVHRDLNPVNVLAGDDGRICLIDFELVERQGASKESYGAGTAGYMSPGQAANAPATVLDDVFGLGALLFLAATGTDPPSGTSDPRAVTDAARESNPALTEVIAAVIAACLSFEEGRIATAASVRTSLERALRG